MGSDACTTGPPIFAPPACSCSPPCLLLLVFGELIHAFPPPRSCQHMLAGVGGRCPVPVHFPLQVHVSRSMDGCVGSAFVPRLCCACICPAQKYRSTLPQCQPEHRQQVRLGYQREVHARQHAPQRNAVRPAWLISLSPHPEVPHAVRNAPDRRR